MRRYGCRIVREQFVQNESHGADECVAVQVGIVDGSHNQPLENGGGCLHAVGDLAWTEVREPSRECLDQAVAGGRIRRMELFRNPGTAPGLSENFEAQGRPVPIEMALHSLVEPIHHRRHKVVGARESVQHAGRFFDVWAGDAAAHLGITIPHFPNLFLMYGPNTNIVV
jgi:hypothetical protein